MKYFLELAGKNVFFGILLIVLFALAQCGGSETDDGDDEEETELTESQEEEVAGVSQTLLSNIGDIGDLGDSLSEGGDESLSTLEKFQVTVNCQESGTLTIDTDSNPALILFEDCVNTTSEGGAFSFDGTLMFSSSTAGTVNSFDIEYDAFLMGIDPDTSITGEDGEMSFATDGEISASNDSATNITTITITDYTVIINDDDTYTLTASLTIDTTTNTLTGTMSFTINSASVTCDFSSGLDMDTATCPDYATACGFSASAC